MAETRCACITGTDTDAGKTLVTATLARLARNRGLRVLVIKAVQTGAIRKDGGVTDGKKTGLCAPDLVVCASAAPGIATGAVALFEDACSPHLAARKEGRLLTAAGIARDVRAMVRETPPDLVLLEGAGGLFTPVSETETLCDVFALLGWPVLLVAANRLGAVNHALLSLDAIRARGLDCPGFIMNRTGGASSEPGGDLDEAIRRDNPGITARLGGVPCLAAIGHIPGFAAADGHPREAAWETLCAALEPVLDTLTGLPAQKPDARKPDALEDITAYDRAHVWHPYTSATAPLRTWEAVAAKGSRIRLRDGRELVDGMASWWCAIHGYGHPRLVEALERQARAMPHVMFGGLTHEPAVGLAHDLLALAPAGLEHVFFADSGSVAVEVALKMALQYHQAKGNHGRTRLLTVRGGYHGDTFGAMGVCDPENGMHSLFTGMLPGHIFASRPSCRFDAPYNPESERAFEKTLRENKDEIAAVILEPIVQGAGGMWFYHPAYLRRVRDLCTETGCLLILDEIATGFGRTGKMFACEHAGIAPDILCVGKGLTGGVISLAATLATGKVAQGISSDGGVLMHGPTFMGNPLACAAARASLRLLREGTWTEDVARIETALQAGLTPCAEEDGVADVRVLGAIGVVEMAAPVAMEKLQAYFVDQWGVWIRPFGKLIYVMPPYVTADGDIRTLTTAIREAIREGQWK